MNINFLVRNFYKFRKCLFAKETTQSFCVCASESLIYFFVSVNYWHVVGELMVLISRCFGCKKCQKAAFDSKQTSAPSTFFTESIIQFSTSFLAGNLRKSKSCIHHIAWTMEVATAGLESVKRFAGMATDENNSFSLFSQKVPWSFQGHKTTSNKMDLK